MGLSLALAVVASSNAPLLLLDENLRLVAASNTFCNAFHVDVAQVGRRSLFDLGGGEWNVPQLRALLSATVAGLAEVSAYEIDLVNGDDGIRRLALNAQKLDYFAGAPTRLLLTVSDITEARLSEKLKDDLLCEKAVLLQEVQHRVANSLQTSPAFSCRAPRR
jgi:PAS domain-containing protein